MLGSTVSGRNIVFNIPLYAMYADQSIDEMAFNAIAIQWNSKANNSVIANITQEFLNINPNQTYVGVQN